jgi:hypothetical protein
VRRLGGLHRRKKRAIASTYDLRGLRTIEDNQALLERPAIETLALENTIARNRGLAGFAAVGAKLIEVGDHEEGLRVLEATQQLGGGAATEPDAFPNESR